MDFDKEIAQDLAYTAAGGYVEGFKVVLNKLVDITRWATEHELVVESSGKYYRAFYRNGATEAQDESPFEYNEGTVGFKEVHPEEKSITIYK